MELEVVGLYFRPQDAKDVAAKLVQGARVVLIREPTNEHDPNAVKVCVPQEADYGDFKDEELVHIGYLSRDVSAWVTATMEEQDREQIDVTFVETRQRENRGNKLVDTPVIDVDTLLEPENEHV